MHGPIKFTTTVLSSAEKLLIRKMFKGTDFVLEEAMSFETAYLLTYKNVFTDKRILAERWSIPVISVQWVYKSLTEKNILAYRLRKYEGCSFSTSGITNSVFANYYRLLGAQHTSELDRYSDFLVVNQRQKEGDKMQYAEENGIPIVAADGVFQDRVEHMKKDVQYNTFVQDVAKEEMFNGITFYFAGSSDIHKLVRKVIIEHGGTRVEESGSDVTYTVYFGDKPKQKKNLVWYQWILDSAELETLLAPEPYFVKGLALPPLPLKDCAVHLMVCAEELVKSKHKVLALGGSVSMSITSQTTHCVLDSRKDAGAAKKHGHLAQCNVLVCSAEWLNQCIYHMQRIKEQRFSLGAELKPVLQVPPVRIDPQKRAVLRRLPCGLEKWVVQFTGLMEDLKKEAVLILVSRGAAIVDTTEYSSECTHLIVGTVNMSIKFLSAIAAGKEVLDYRIVEDIKRNQFQEEKRYSLKSRDVKIDVGKQQAHILKHIILSADRWKERVEKTGKKAFAEWKVLVLPTKRKSEIEALIKNGGGEVVEYLQENAEPGLEEKALPLDVTVFTTKNEEIPVCFQKHRQIQISDIFKHLAFIESQSHQCHSSMSSTETSSK
ncbi:hypothetical protein NECID01_0788 [Nematocida sp. AWRm77]|nr:hypothetical protein NECID01_0788 [Nematocida sp. AWRm77]